MRNTMYIYIVYTQHIYIYLHIMYNMYAVSCIYCTYYILSNNLIQDQDNTHAPKISTPKNARRISNIQQHFVLTQNQLKESPCLTCAGPDDLRLLKQLLSSSATSAFSASFSVAKMSRVAVAAISAFCRFSPIS